MADGRFVTDADRWTIRRYHVGFAAYRWLLERLRPPLWLHGHTTPATVADWRDKFGTSMVVNVTGSVVVELVPPPA